MHCDLFNGDADGIFSLHLYRRHAPLAGARLISGVKRDNALLRLLVDQPATSLAVFDLPLAANRDALDRLLAAGCQVEYFDHHAGGELPSSPLFHPHIDTAAETCTALIVDAFIHRHGGMAADGRNKWQPSLSLWAVCAAFADNLHRPARELAGRLRLRSEQTAQLQELGELFNYNGYGETEADLHFPPVQLYNTLQGYTDPFAYLAEASEPAALRDGYREDIDKAGNLRPEPGPGRGRLYLLPAEAWARRVSGVFANQRARELPEAAHAIISENRDGSLRVSVRAPLTARRDADHLCRGFAGGGGRAAAAGITALPREELPLFIDRFHSLYP